MGVTTAEREESKARLIAAVEAAVRDRGGDLSRREAKFRCPETAKHANGDADPSASWNTQKRQWKCHVCGAGGGYVDLARMLGLLPASNGSGKPSAVWKIRDISGRVVAEHRRYDRPDGKKDCVWYGPDGKKGLERLGIKLAALPLYGTHELPNIPKGATIVVTEGEKARDSLQERGVPAVGTVTGASTTPNLDAWGVLDGYRVILWPDEDGAGYDHMARAADRLRQLGIEPRAMVWTDAPEAGDGFDWFATGRTADELRELLAAAPEWTIPAPERQHEQHDAEDDDGFVSAADLVCEPEEVVAWTVEGLLPAGGLSLLSAKPKVGKSTLARSIAVAVAQGAAVLDRGTMAGTVLYLALEEKRATVRRHLDALGARHVDALKVYADRVPMEEEPVAWLRRAIERYKPSLVVIDPVGRFFVGVKDLNAYAEVTRATTPLVALAHETGTHLLCIHHAGKGEKADIDAAIGSTALAGFVDTVMVLKRTSDGARSLVTIQRTGDDLPETVLALDRESGRLSLAGTLQEVRQSEAADGILRAVGPDCRTETQIRQKLGGNNAVIAKALRLAVERGKLVVHGAGKKGDPFRYYRPGEELEEHPSGESVEAGKRAKHVSEHSPLDPADPAECDSRFLASSLPRCNGPGIEVCSAGDRDGTMDREEILRRAVAVFGAEVHVKGTA